MSNAAWVEFDRILKLYHHIILLRGEIPIESKLPPFEVHLKNNTPIASQSYRTSFPLRPILQQILDKNMKNGLMERASSPWSSPTLLVKKPSGDYRLVVDYRAVNEVIAADHYPLPKISDLIVNLHNSKYFIQTDLCQGFFQIKMEALKKFCASGTNLANTVLIGCLWGLNLHRHIFKE